MASANISGKFAATAIGLSALLGGCWERSDVSEARRVSDGIADFDPNATSLGDLQVTWPDELASTYSKDGLSKRIIDLRDKDQVAAAMKIDLSSAGDDPLLYKILLTSITQSGGHQTKLVPIHVSNIDQGADIILSMQALMDGKPRLLGPDALGRGADGSLPLR